MKEDGEGGGVIVVSGGKKSLDRIKEQVKE